MAVKVFVEDFRGLLAKVPPLSPGVQEPRPQYHDGLARRLLELRLNAEEFPVNNLNHSLDFFRGDRSGSALLTEQVHHMGGKVVAGLLVLFQLETQKKHSM